MNADDNQTGDRPVLVSVLTPVLNESDGLEEVLRRFQEQADPGGAIEFLFVDGRSTDDTRAKLERAAVQDPRIRMLDNPRRLTSSALNVALPEARGEFVARMDAHALYPPDYLRTGVERLRRGDAAAVSGPQVAVGRDPWSNRVAVALGTAMGIGGSNFRRAIDVETETDSGFTGLWRRDTLVAHGGWDELAYPNEDTELASRIREAGGRLILVPAMAAEYTPRNSLGSLAKQYWRYGRGRGRTARMHPISIRKSHALSPGLVVIAVTSVGPGRGLRRVARAGLLIYAAAVLVTTATVKPRRNALYVALVLPTMHLSWGAGYLVGITTRSAAVKPG